ncbi:MAG: restriction endonuclease [Anaerolineae bacterium]|nr:restriction endonuclease [Anaerolineae bacterium]
MPEPTSNLRNPFANVNYNPDVLSCLANLSSDEVFTPPAIANQMLDLLPQEIWRDPTATFLDPAVKTGIFLREIAKRLNAGLAEQIPDRQERINHIFTKQIFGVAITEITALLSRRSVYCAKKANGKYSVCTAFHTPEGNIVFERMIHEWKGERCKYCGANLYEYDRDPALESHAYQFIHTEDPQEIFKMKFDVVIGNPPYQLSDAGFGRSASPIYQIFVEQAKKLNPRYLTMIIPSRWFAGGKGLDEFRRNMLNDNRIRKLVDFEDANEVFPGVDIAGGICYFLWERDYKGTCEVTNVLKGTSSTSSRKLNEFKTFIRYSQAVSIIRKVLAKGEAKMNEQVSSRKPFGLPTTERPQKSGDLILYWQKGEGPYNRKDVRVGVEMIDTWKVITSRTGHEHAGNPGKDGKRRVLSKIALLPPGTICNETYIVIGSYKNKIEAENLVAYMKTRFFRFLLSLHVVSQDITKDNYFFVPALDMSIRWTDEMLYKRYELTETEIDFIKSKIEPMGEEYDA